MSPGSQYWLNIPSFLATKYRINTSWQMVVPGSLLHPAAVGGSATVYRMESPATLTGYVLKIYNPDRLSEVQTLPFTGKLHLISKLATGQVPGAMAFAQTRPYVSWPLISAYSKQVVDPQKLVGFVMPHFTDALSLAYIAMPRMREKHFPNAKPSHLFAVDGQLAHNLHKLHFNPPNYRAPSNIVFGDLSLNNILIDKHTYQTYFLDADSYQFTSVDGPQVLVPPATATPMTANGPTRRGTRCRSASVRAG